MKKPTDHPRWLAFVAWCRETHRALESVEWPGWWAQYLRDGGTQEQGTDRRKRVRGEFPCTWGCGMVFASPHTAREHNSQAHYECPTCRRWYRDLTAHWLASQRRPVARGRPGWNCWLRLPAEREVTP